MPFHAADAVEALDRIDRHLRRGSRRFARQPAVAKHLFRAAADHIEMTVGSEQQIRGSVQFPGIPLDNHLVELPAGRVVAQNLIRKRTCHVKVFIRTEGQAGREIQSTAAGEHVDECTGRAVEPQNLLSTAAQDKQRAVRAKRGDARLTQLRVGGERVQKRADVPFADPQGDLLRARNDPQFVIGLPIDAGRDADRVVEHPVVVQIPCIEQLVAVGIQRGRGVEHQRLPVVDRIWPAGVGHGRTIVRRHVDAHHHGAGREAAVAGPIGEVVNSAEARVGLIGERPVGTQRERAAVRRRDKLRGKRVLIDVEVVGQQALGSRDVEQTTLDDTVNVGGGDGRIGPGRDVDGGDGGVRAADVVRREIAERVGAVKIGLGRVDKGSVAVQVERAKGRAGDQFSGQLVSVRVTIVGQQARHGLAGGRQPQVETDVAAGGPRLVYFDRQHVRALSNQVRIDREGEKAILVRAADRLRGPRLAVDFALRQIAADDLLPVEIDHRAVVAEQVQGGAGQIAGHLERVPKIRRDEAIAARSAADNGRLLALAVSIAQLGGARRPQHVGKRRLAPNAALVGTVVEIFPNRTGRHYVEADHQRRVFVEKINVVQRHRHIVGRADRNGHPGSGRSRLRVACLVEETVATEEILLGRVDKRAVGRQRERAVLGRFEQCGAQRITLGIDVVGQHTGGGVDR